MAENYSPDNVSNKVLEESLWVLRHKTGLIKIGTIALLILDTLVLGWVLFSYVDYWLGSGVAERKNIATQTGQTILLADLQKQLTPKPLAISDVQLFGGREDKYDLGVEIANDNDNIWGEFEYEFAGANFITPPVTGVILPKTRKWLLQLGQSSPARPANMRLVFSKFVWHRISRHDYPDYAGYAKEHFGFTSSDVSFGHSALAQGTLNQVNFTLTNNSAYAFWQVPVAILLFRGDQIVGFNQVTLEKVGSLETRPVVVSWQEGLPQVTRVDIQPDVNILDQSVYMP